MLDEWATNVEDAKMCVHAPAMSLEALSAIRRCCRDMEAVLCASHPRDALPYHPPTRYDQRHRPGGTGSAQTRKGARATRVVLALSGLPPPWDSVE